MNPHYPIEEPDTRTRQDEADRRKRMKKFGYMENIDGLTQVLPQIGTAPIPSDVLGSYTGTAADDPMPVQDADDL